MTFPALAHADWNQIYLSAGVGADTLTDDGRITPPDTQGHISYGGPIGGDLGWGLGAGVDAQLSQLFVVGAFANFDWSSIDTRGTLHTNSTTVDVSAFELKNAWTVGGRAGVLITSSTLVYGLLGYSWLDFDNLRITAVDSNDGSRGSDSGGGFARVLNEPIRKGITLGGGIEQKITPNLSLKAEYRFTDLGDVDQAIDTVQIDRHSKIQMVRVGAAYRIGWGDSATGSHDQAPVTGTWSGFRRRRDSRRRLRAKCFAARRGRLRKPSCEWSGWGGHFRFGDGWLRPTDCTSMAHRSLRRLRLDGSGF